MPFRGRFVSFYQLAIVVGLLGSYVSNYFLLALGDDAWRWMFTAGVLPAALFFCLLLVPETPRWLVKSGRESRALDVPNADRWRRLCRPGNGRDSANAARRKGRLADLLQPRVARIVVIGASLGVFSQISGANAVFTYAPVIFSQAAAKHDNAGTQSVSPRWKTQSRTTPNCKMLFSRQPSSASSISSPRSSRFCWSNASAGVADPDDRRRLHGCRRGGTVLRVCAGFDQPCRPSVDPGGRAGFYRRV